MPGGGQETGRLGAHQPRARHEHPRTVDALDELPVAALLRRPKRHAPDDGVNGTDVTGDLGWGAGVAFKGLKPTYKAGWGGLGRALVYEQVIHVRGVGIAVTFEPRARPAHDDPYRTSTPQALRDLLRALRPRLGLGV